MQPWTEEVESVQIEAPTQIRRDILSHSAPLRPS